MRKEEMEKLMNQGMRFYEREKKQEDWKCVSGCVFGAERRFRPRELFHRDISPYFPAGRKRCRRYLEAALRDFADDKCYQRIYLSGKGPIAKMAAKILGELQKTHPNLEVQVWVPSLQPLPNMRPYQRRFRACSCTVIPLFGKPWQAHFALMLRSDMGIIFDVNPNSKNYYDQLTQKTDCWCTNLALEEDRKAYH